MELLRWSRNPWGQETLQGVSWDLLWLFVGAGAVLIVLHMLYMWLWAPRLDREPGEGEGR
jgi:hypothetical protein